MSDWIVGAARFVSATRGAAVVVVGGCVVAGGACVVAGGVASAGGATVVVGGVVTAGAVVSVGAALDPL